MRLLLIDNYDSFTYNLYHLFASVAGEAPVVRSNDACAWSQLRDGGFDGMILSPGPGRPERERDFGVCADILRFAEVPVLGVCLGCQGLGSIYGVPVVEAPEPMHGRISAIQHDGSALFEGIPQGFEAVRYHSLMVADCLPACLERSAWTADGVIMGLRHRERPLQGVQFHPESICTAHGGVLARNFCRLTAQWGARFSPVAGWRAPVVEATAMGGAASGGAVAATDEPRRRFVTVRRLEGWREPESVFTGLFAEEEHAFWLDSSMVTPGEEVYSYLGCGRSCWTYRLGAAGGESVFEALTRALRGELAGDVAAGFPFMGGLVGYLGYELKAECGAAAGHRSPWPDAGFLVVDRFLAFDHGRRQVSLVAVDVGGELAPATLGWLARMEAAYGRVPVAAPEPAVLPVMEGGAWRAGRTRAEYLADVRSCQARIREGETYEVCLTTPHVHAGRVDPLAFYRRARRMQPVPYGAFLRLPGFVIAGCSPERFVRVDADGWVESRPIKGTMPRGGTAAEDAALRDRLSRSEKNRSENLMIVDLVRNDLGRVCEVGTVQVSRLMAIESYASVHQMVSTIRGRLRPGITAPDCLRAAFPPGSMTGAPKLRTLEILDGLEVAARGVYSGCLGYLSYNGAADLSVVIRTAVVEPERVVVGAGGAIVALSDPEVEYAEMGLKAAVMQRVLAEG